MVEEKSPSLVVVDRVTLRVAIHDDIRIRLHSSPFISLLPYISMIFISVLMMTSRYVQGTAFVIPTMLRLKEFVSRMEHKGRDAAARGVCV